MLDLLKAHRLYMSFSGAEYPSPKKVVGLDKPKKLKGYLKASRAPDSLNPKLMERTKPKP